MPKTRRAGRKNQLRRLLARYHQPNLNDFTNSIGVDYRSDPEYDRLFERRDNNNLVLAEWPAKLALIQLEAPSLPPFDIPESDPRRAKYLEIRAEILYEHYGGATPPHWGTASHPLTLE